MLEGSFHPPTSATAIHHYPHPKAAYADHPSSMSNIRRKELVNTNGPSFTPIHDRSLGPHSPEYDSEEHHQSGSPPAHHPRFFHHHQQAHSSAGHAPMSHSQSASSAFRQQSSETLSSAPTAKTEPKSSLEPAAKNSSFGPVRAKKKPAGSACNSCHRLKTRCSGGYPCDRCAAHKVPCQFDRDLIYRSPLASSSQQASARNAQAMSNGEPGVAAKPRSRASAGGPKAPAKRAAPVAAVAAAATPQPVNSVPTLPPTLPENRLSPPSTSAPRHPIVTQHPGMPVAARKQAPKSTAVSTPAPSEVFIGYDPNPPPQNGLHLRLAALESSVSGLLQVLRGQHPSAPVAMIPAAEHRLSPASPPLHPPTLVVSASSASFGPERDHNGDNPMGTPSNLGGIGDPLSEGILSPNQVQYLYDVFVECCLPSLPILHRVQISVIRGRSAFLFSAMLAIGARFCSSQSVTHHPTSGGTITQSGAMAADKSTPVIDEPTYGRLVALAYRHLSATLLKAAHTLEDVRAILFLACWALVSNEDPNGPPNRWVLVGHAGRIGRSIGLDRCVHDTRAAEAPWSNQELHQSKREQLDAIKTDQALRSIETILSSTLRVEPSRDYLPSVSSSSARAPKSSLLKLATGSPFQYDIVSAAQIQAQAELAELWAEANSFLSAADERVRALSGEQLVDLSERHNQALDAWAKKWTWHGSSWAPLLGGNLRTIRLLSESLRVTLNLALTNVLYAMVATGGIGTSIRFQETLAMALERVNGSSTAVIQAHRDSAREGFSLAFAPDLVTDGLVSAAITVLQLASPIGLGPTAARFTAKEANKAATSTNDKADVEMSDVTVTNASSSAGHGPQLAKSHRQVSTASSSPSTTPRRVSSSCSPQVSAPLIASPLTGGVNEVVGKKALMEPAVAAHYIRMAADVLHASDRSQTRLGTTMASKIIRLATHAGLMGSQPMSSSSTSATACGGAALSVTTTLGMTDAKGRSSVSSASSSSSKMHMGRSPEPAMHESSSKQTNSQEDAVRSRSASAQSADDASAHAGAEEEDDEEDEDEEEEYVDQSLTMDVEALATTTDLVPQEHKGDDDDDDDEEEDIEEDDEEVDEEEPGKEQENQQMTTGLQKTEGDDDVKLGEPTPVAADETMEEG